MKTNIILAIITALCLWQSVALGQIGCMDKSQHGYRCNYNCDCPCGPDRKQFYYVDCACECWRYPMDKHCRCLNCGHYRRPEQFKMINKKDFHEQNARIQHHDNECN